MTSELAVTCSGRVGPLGWRRVERRRAAAGVGDARARLPRRAGGSGPPRAAPDLAILSLRSKAASYRSSWKSLFPPTIPSYACQPARRPPPLLAAAVDPGISATMFQGHVFVVQQSHCTAQTTADAIEIRAGPLHKTV